MKLKVQQQTKSGEKFVEVYRGEHHKVLHDVFHKNHLVLIDNGRTWREPCWNSYMNQCVGISEET